MTSYNYSSHGIITYIESCSYRLARKKYGKKLTNQVRNPTSIPMTGLENKELQYITSERCIIFSLIPYKESPSNKAVEKQSNKHKQHKEVTLNKYSYLIIKVVEHRS